VELLEKIEALPVPNFRKKQIIHAIFQELKPDFASISTLPKELRAQLDEQYKLRTLKILKTQVSSAGDTIKWSLLTAEGQPIETVLMMHENGRRTLCVSCQSGCPVNCSFCWTGAMGFKQNLSSWEIIEQLLIANEWLRANQSSIINLQSSMNDEKALKASGFNSAFEAPKVTKLVYMGMGEPMINLIAVSESIKVLTNPEYFGISQRSITVSTSGYIPMMKKFWAEFTKVGLAISLHAPNQRLREQLMPVAKQFKLDELIQVCRELQIQTKRRITYEYILIDQVTDTEDCADDLVDLLQGQLAHVNLIPYNPIEGRDFQRPSRNRVMRFKQHLEDAGISATARVTMGDDIKAACGQLSFGDHDLVGQPSEI
jgi:23S rRNA (adenine2503-C2)-methyltransferase